MLQPKFLEKEKFIIEVLAMNLAKYQAQLSSLHEIFKICKHLRQNGTGIYH